MIQLLKFKNYLLCMLAMTSCFTSMADEYSNCLSAKVEKAKGAGTIFEACTLFNGATGYNHEAIVKDATVLNIDKQKVNALYSNKPAAVSFIVVDAFGKTVTLDMLQSQPLAYNAEMGSMTANGGYRLDNYDRGLHYQGCIQGSARSVAAMSVFANGDVMILFANGDGNYNIGKLDDGSSRYIMYNDKNMQDHVVRSCRYKSSGLPHNMGSGEKTTSATKTCKRVRMYWEIDYDTYIAKGSLSATQNYFIGLFNQEQALFANDDLLIELSAMYVWQTQDTYLSSIAGSEIFLFSTYWGFNNHSFNGDLAMLMTHDGGGGVAFGNIPVCDKKSAYAYSGLDLTYKAIPTYSWDVEVVAHETGHQYGLDHTHNCVWMTGAGGTCGAIDDCATIEPSTGCTTCGSVYHKSTPGWKGTIMSYCDNGSIGIDLSLGFGPLPVAMMHKNINNCPILQTKVSATLIPTVICSSNGAVDLAFNGDNSGTAPYTYSWSNNATTQNISGLSTAGDYTVTITDSNKCTASYTAAVTKLATPGDGINPLFVPFCCKDTSFVFTLSATAPANLLPCQTVAWLRTAAPITSYADAKAAFTTAALSDIIQSSNAAAITSGVSATLNVPSPQPCVAQAYYYTPFVARAARTAITVSDGATTSGIIQYRSYQLGNSASLPDKTAMVTVCDRSDTSTAQSLAVTITNYTGRINHLSISVQTSTGEGLYFMHGLAGNGTYNIPVKAGDNILRGLKISAFDYNMHDEDIANTSSLSISVSRSVAYPAYTSLRFEDVCEAGKSSLLSFAPTGCTPVSVALQGAINENEIKLFPNPASHTATLSFNASGNGNARLKVADVIGKTVEMRNINYYAGSNAVSIAVKEWPKGVYILSLSNNTGIDKKLKLVVE